MMSPSMSLGVPPGDEYHVHVRPAVLPCSGAQPTTFDWSGWSPGVLFGAVAVVPW
jgi:hypothetical protein